MALGTYWSHDYRSQSSRYARPFPLNKVSLSNSAYAGGTRGDHKVVLAFFAQSDLLEIRDIPPVRSPHGWTFGLHSSRLAFVRCDLY